MLTKTAWSSNRVELSNDRTAVSKWAAVLMLALVTQLAIAVVHLE
jgi:hypothetical protein